MSRFISLDEAKDVIRRQNEGPVSPRCGYPHHPFHLSALVAVEDQYGGFLRHYKCPTCGKEAKAFIANEVKPFGG